MRIYTSKHDQPIIEIQPTLGPVCNTTPLTLAYTASPGFAEHYDACRKCITEKTVHRIATYLHTEKVKEATADTKYHVVPENQTAIAHEIIIYDHVTDPPDTIYDEETDGRDIEGISFGPEFIAQPFSFTQDRGDTEMNDEPSKSTAPNSNIQEEDVSTIVPQHFQAQEKLLSLLHQSKRRL